MSEQVKGKNIIWFVVDQMRSSAMSINGDPNIKTPNLDLLAKQGVNFKKAVSGTPLCSPFRGCMLTGEYAHKSTVAGHDFSLDPNKKTLVDVFNSKGYDTLYYGKWHMDGNANLPKGVDPKKQFIPRDRRAKFSTWLGYENNNSQFECFIHGHDGESEVKLKRLKKFETDALTDMIIDKINYYGTLKKEDEKNFFMVLSVQPPHDPFTAPPEFAGRFNPQQLILRKNVPPYEDVEQATRTDLAGYYALIENIDWNMGRIREALRKNDLDLDTHILFFSDHGEMLGSHGMIRKTNPFEESIRIPFIIGGEVPMDYYGRRCGETDSLINHIDIAPTTLGLCGIDKPNWMKGFDYSIERYKGEISNIPETAFLQLPVPTGHGNSTNQPWRGVVTKDNWKYVCTKNNEWLLFNLNKDPYELVNLVHNSKYKEKRKELNCILRDWIIKADDDFEIPIIEIAF